MVDRTKEILDGAVATNKGWVDALTGELLVSIRGLPGAIEWTKEFVADIKAATDVVAEAVSDIKEEITEAIDEVKDIVEDKSTKSKKNRTKKTAE